MWAYLLANDGYLIYFNNSHEELWRVREADHTNHNIFTLPETPAQRARRWQHWADASHPHPDSQFGVGA